MDILHLTKEQISKMEFNEFLLAINYCWTSYNDRRVGFWMNKTVEAISQMLGVKWKNTNNTNSNKGMDINFKLSNPVYQELERKKNKPTPPEKFLKEINK